MINTSEICEHMPVIAASGEHVGTVDHLEGPNQIKLTKTDSTDGTHHYIPLDWVDHIDQHVHLNKSAAEIAAYRQ